MTIKLLAAYGAYPINSLVQLDAATEAALVTAKQATTSLEGAVVFAESAIVSPDHLFKAAAGNVLTKSFLGRFAVKANGANHTTHIQFALESEWDAIRFLIPNGTTSAISGVKATFSSGGAAGAINDINTISPSDGSWSSARVADSTSITLPAGASVDDPSWTVTDWILRPAIARSDGGKIPIGHVRIFIPAAAANRTAYAYPGIVAWGDEAAVSGRIWRPRTQAIDGVTTLSPFTIAGSAVDYECHPVVIQYVSRRRGLSILVIGDSIFEKAGDPNRIGWQDYAQWAVSTKDKPVEIATLSIGGSNSATWAKRLGGVVGLVRPDFVFMSCFETNDAAVPMTANNIRDMRASIGVAQGYARAAGAIAVLTTGIPSASTGNEAKLWGESDQLRRDLIASWKALAGSRPIIDTDAVVAGVTTANGQVEIIADYTSDGLHLSSAGHAAVAAKAVEPALRTMVAQSLE